MENDNPYLNRQKSVISGPPIFKMPFFKFKSADKAMEELELGETCIAKVPAVKEKYGPTHIISLLHKDEDGNTYDLRMVEHHPVLKPGTEKYLAGLKKKKTKKSLKTSRNKNAGK